jgi:OTU domain-containing protein 5
MEEKSPQEAPAESLTVNELRKKELAIIRVLFSNGMLVRKMAEDGNCLFSAISDQLYGTPNFHIEIRKTCCEYLKIEAQYYKNFTTCPDDFDQYIENMGKISVWGGNIELQCLSELYNVKIEIYVWSMDPLNTFNEDCDTDYDTIKLFYRKKGHYDSIKPKDSIHSSLLKINFGILEKEALELANSRNSTENGESPDIKNARLKFERKIKKD